MVYTQVGECLLRKLMGSQLRGKKEESEVRTPECTYTQSSPSQELPEWRV